MPLPYRIMLVVAALGFTPGPMLRAEESQTAAAWRVYAVCVAAFIEEISVRDMAAAYASARFGGPGRRPEPADKLVREGFSTCGKFRAKLVVLHRAENPKTAKAVIESREKGLETILVEELRNAQKIWQQRGYYGTPAQIRNTTPNPFTPGNAVVEPGEKK